MGTPAKEEEGPDVSGKGMVWQHGWEPRAAVAQARPAGRFSYLSQDSKTRESGHAHAPPIDFETCSRFTQIRLLGDKLGQS